MTVAFDKRARVAYLAASFASLASFYLVTVSALWQVYELTGSVANVGLASLFQFLPALLLYPVVGPLTDRVEKRRLLTAAALATLGLSLGLAALAALGRLDAGTLFAAVALASAIRSFEAPALAAWVPEWVPPHDLSRVIALVSAVKQVAKISAPALSGLLLLVHGLGLAVYGAMALLALTTLGALALIRVPARHREARAGKGLEEIWAGFRYVLVNRVLAGALLLDLAAGFLGGFTALLPVFAKEILHTDAAGAGLLRSLVAVGSLAGAAGLAAFPLRVQVGRSLLLSVGLLGLVTTALAFTTSFPAAAALIALFGALDSVSVNIRQTLIQLATPDGLRGRVSATSQIFILVSNQLGEFRAGMMAAVAGVFPTIFLGGAFTVLAASLWSRFFPRLAGLDRFDDATSDPYGTDPLAAPPIVSSS